MTSTALELEGADAEGAAWRARAVEFLLVGGATLLLFPLSWWLQASVGVGSATLAAGFVTFHAAYVINDPHFAVTYLLFYRDFKARAFGAALPRAQRVRYWLAGIILPALLLSWSALSLSRGSALGLGWMIQLMFLLVGWHYVKQGFGVLAVLCARRGVALRGAERTALLVHAFAAWAYAWASPAAGAGLYEEKGVVYSALARPLWLELGTGFVLLASSFVLLVRLALGWHRERRLLPLAPLAGFLITLWCWTIYSALDPVVRYAIPALHSIQYLYFVWLLRRNQAREEEGPPSFGKPSGVRLATLAISALGLGWLLLRGAPTLLDELALGPLGLGSGEPAADGTALGATPFFAVCFVFVNLHHYLMDYVIWRREHPEARHLVARALPARLEFD